MEKTTETVIPVVSQTGRSRGAWAKQIKRQKKPSFFGLKREKVFRTAALAFPHNKAGENTAIILGGEVPFPGGLVNPHSQWNSKFRKSAAPSARDGLTGANKLQGDRHRWFVEKTARQWDLNARYGWGLLKKGKGDIPR